MVVTSGRAGDTDFAARFSAKPAIFHCLAAFFLWARRGYFDHATGRT